MKIEELRLLNPMKYWSLPPKASQNQKDKMAKMLDSKNYFLTLKRDGAWYRWSKSEQDSILQSRTVSRTTGEFVEKGDRVPHIMEELDRLLPANTMLVGEICFEKVGKTSSDVVSIMGSLPGRAIKKQEEEEKLVYYVFDVLMYNGKEYHDKNAIDRLAMLETIFEKHNLFSSKYIKLVEFHFDNIPDIISEWLSVGHEGGVLINKTAKYTFGKKPAWSSIKIKQSLTEDLDLIIMGTTEPVVDYTGKYPSTHEYWENMKTGEKVQGLYHGEPGYKPVTASYFKGLVGGLRLGLFYGDELFEVCKISNLTDELRLDLTQNFEKYKGKVAEVDAMSIDVEKRSLRHPKLVRVRLDKKAEECISYDELF